MTAGLNPIINPGGHTEGRVRVITTRTLPSRGASPAFTARWR